MNVPDTVMEKAYSQIGQRIREIRMSRKISQIELSTRCGVEPSNLNRIEHGKANPTVRTLHLIAVALGVGYSAHRHKHKRQQWFSDDAEYLHTP